MAANPLGGFNFGSNVNAVKPTPAAGFSLGAATTTTSSGFSLNLGGATAAPAATVAPTLGGFGGFGTAKTTQATAVVPPLGGGLSGFGSTATPAPATGFGGFGSAATSAATTGFGAAAPSTGFTATSGGLAGGFGGLAAPTTTVAAAPPKATVGLGGNSVAPTFSLGGSQTSQASAGGGAVSTTESAKSDQVKNVKDCMIPIELDHTVEQVKKHMKDEKSVCSDISHYSDKAYTKIKQETDALSQLVTILSIGIHKNRSTLEKLKLSSAQELVNTDIACRTKETAASMQYENVAPMDYFMRLVAQFETDMTEYRKQIDQTQQQLQLMTSGGAVSSADISLAIQRLYAAFTELAARYQGIHLTLMKCKEQYIAVHRRVHGTSVPAFEKSSSCNPVPNLSTTSLAKLTGPNPFSAPSDPLIQARQIVPNKGQSNTVMGPPTLGLNVTGTPAGAFGGTAAAANTTAFGSGNLSVTNTTGFGGNTTAFGGNTTGFGGNTTGFGTNTTGFGASTTGFGGNTTGFGGNTTGLGGNTTGFGGNATSFGGNTTFGSPGFGSSTGIFGSPSSFGSPTVGSKRNKI